MKYDSVPLDDPALGPEFSVRVLSVAKNNGCVTIGDLRAKLPELKKWRGLGAKSIREIESYYRCREAEEEDLFETPEFRCYKLEETIGTVEALIQTVQRSLTRAAIKGCVSADTRTRMRLLLLDAAERMDGLPLVQREV